MSTGDDTPVAGVRGGTPESALMITRGRPWAWALGMGAVALVALAGCTASDASTSPTLTPLPTAPSTRSALPTPSPTPSVTPSLAVAKAGPPPKTPFTKQGAETFVRSYYLTANQALHQGRASYLARY